MKYRLLGVCALALTVAAVGCGDDDDGDGTGGSAAGTASGGGGSGASGSGGCQSERITISGTVDGTDIDVQADVSGRMVNQASDPKMLSISFSGGSVSFEWANQIPNGQMTAATGRTTIDGTTYCFASGELTLDDSGYDRFTLGDLSESSGTDCPGTAVSGSLEGCSDAD